MDKVPFYYAPHPDPKNQAKMEKDMEEATEQAVKYVVALIVSFLLLGIFCATMHYLKIM